MWTVVVFVLVWSLRATASSGGVTCNEKEKQALLAFKQALSSDPSGALSSWSLDVRNSDCCNWRGVRCNNMTDRVIELDLSNLNLTGNLTPSLLDLKFLSYLDLSFNNLGGSPIPSFLGSMTSLVHMDLHDNAFYGLIPDQLQNLSNIRYLNLGFNNFLFVHNLNWITHLRALEYLNMCGVDLKSEADWLHKVSSLPFLSELHLRDCHLENMTPPLEHVNFTSLALLDLSNNFFNCEILKWLFTHVNFTSLALLDLSLNYNFKCEIPKWLFNLNSLQSLLLNDNLLHGFIPYEVGQLKHLQELNLGLNELNGPIPKSLGNLSSLSSLYLNDNQLNGTFPKSIWVRSNLENLEIGNNHLEGIVTEVDLSKHSKLRSLDLSGNSFSFDISSTWVPPFQLKILSVSSCKMGPHFPSWLKTQTSLSELDISKTGISDTIPHWFWDLALHIDELIDLSHNEIDGDLSSVILNSSVIDINSNRFRGKLQHIGSNVAIFSISNNNFSGTIFTFLCQKENKQNILEILDASYNLLSGKLSHCWMNWQSLIHVNLGNNNLSGEIPISMGYLSKLESLQLNNNKLHGCIPSSLQNCQFLDIMNLGENELTGTMPSWLGHMTSLSILCLNSNRFTGSISPDICHLSFLTILNLASNTLSGSIPYCLNNISEMVSIDKGGFRPVTYYERLRLVTKGRESEYQEILLLVKSIDLSSNNLSGSIPSEISSLAGLQFLNLSHNQFIGKLPEKLGDMKMLESLDVSRNHLSGEIPQSISTLTFLDDLNLSFNNLYGSIPTSTQLQSFNESRFIGNQGLCGAPLKINCTNERNYPKRTFATRKDVKESEMFWFYISMMFGFIIGFWGVCGTLLLKKTWRYAYFQFVDDMNNHIYVIAILTMNWMHRKFERSTNGD